MTTEAPEVYTVELPEHKLLKGYMQFVAKMPERNDEKLLSQYMAQQHVNSLNENSTVTGTEHDLMILYREICGGMLAGEKLRKAGIDRPIIDVNAVDLIDCAWRILMPFKPEEARKLREKQMDFTMLFLIKELFG